MARDEGLGTLCLCLTGNFSEDETTRRGGTEYELDGHSSALVRIVVKKDGETSGGRRGSERCDCAFGDRGVVGQ